MGLRFFRHKFTRIEAIGSDQDDGNVRLAFALQQPSAVNGDGAVAGFDSAARWEAVY